MIARLWLFLSTTTIREARPGTVSGNETTLEKLRDSDVAFAMVILE